MLFKDFPHSNTLISNKGKLIIKKELDNKDILNKEYQVLKFLEKYKFTPKVWGLSATGYFEEFINGNKLSTKDLTIDNLKS